MKVKATAAGFYLSKRSPGDEFDIPHDLFATEWMESLEPKDIDAKTEAANKAKAEADRATADRQAEANLANEPNENFR